MKLSKILCETFENCIQKIESGSKLRNDQVKQFKCALRTLEVSGAIFYFSKNNGIEEFLASRINNKIFAFEELLCDFLDMRFEGALTSFSGKLSELPKMENLFKRIFRIVHILLCEAY